MGNGNGFDRTMQNLRGRTAKKLYEWLTLSMLILGFGVWAADTRYAKKSEVIYAVQEQTLKRYEDEIERLNIKEQYEGLEPSERAQRSALVGKRDSLRVRLSK